jgi:hypothetical protein
MMVRVEVQEHPYNADEAREFASLRRITTIEVDDWVLDASTGEPIVTREWSANIRVGAGAQEPTGVEIDRAVRELLVQRASRELGREQDRPYYVPGLPRPASVQVFKADYAGEHTFEVR